MNYKGIIPLLIGLYATLLGSERYPSAQIRSAITAGASATER